MLRVPPAWACRDGFHGRGRYVDPWTVMRNSTVQAMRLHYYAATSFMDSIVGKLLAAVEAHGATASTIVCFHADHGCVWTGIVLLHNMRTADKE